jgi:hypothetical protein
LSAKKAQVNYLPLTLVPPTTLRASSARATADLITPPSSLSTDAKRESEVTGDKSEMEIVMTIWPPQNFAGEFNLCVLLELNLLS